jgi:hypothetical protein
MSEEYQWERRTGGMKECWDLRRYRIAFGRTMSDVVGTTRKQKNKHRCRKWIVAASNGWDFTHVCVLDDMKRPEALEAAKMLILLSLKQTGSEEST